MASLLERVLFLADRWSGPTVGHALGGLFWGAIAGAILGFFVGLWHSFRSPGGALGMVTLWMFGVIVGVVIGALAGCILALVLAPL